MLQLTQPAPVEVLVTGVFNIIHPGHVDLLKFASEYGKITVGLNGDEYNKNKNGDKAIPVIERIKVLKAIRYVDNVMVFNEEDPSELITKLKPIYFVRGPDYLGKTLKEESALNYVNATLLISPGRKKYDSRLLT